VKRILPRVSLSALVCSLCLAPSWFAAGCGADDFASADAGKSPGGDYYENPGNNGGSAAGSSGSGSDGQPPPPERELESSYGAPVATGKYVWIANPESGRVAYIDAASLTVSLLDAGNGPTFVAAIPSTDDTDRALVLNVLSKDATLMTKTPEGLSTQTFAVPTGGNTWAISADGTWAIAWTDAARVEKKSSADGFQDLTVINLVTGVSVPLGVGYRPVTLGFDAAVTKAFAITQDGVSVIDLMGEDGPLVTKNVAIGQATQDENGALTRDVALTPDGAYALVRRDGELTLSIVSLGDDTRLDLPLSSPATDLDLSADGTYAVAVLRETNEALILPLPAAATDPEAGTLVPLGENGAGSVSLAAQGGTALFYTNAVPSQKLTVLAATTPGATARTVLLRAPVEAVVPSFDGAFGIVLHASLLDDTGALAYPAAMSLLPIQANLPAKIVGLPAPPVSVAFLPTGERALIATGKKSANGVSAGGPYHMHIASFPSLAVQSVVLASEPIAAGVVPEAHRGFVAQRHPEGRITFVDFDTSDVRTITGFELAAQVVDGSVR
jgi:hypothetical protein